MTETRRKSFLKTLSWRIIALITTVGVAYLFTHSISQSFWLSLTSNILSMILYYIHERIWASYK